ncbi:MAG: hypothetical protein H6747_09570 [Deltaproteobacteria bacterium]|nr:hypothetical protein [Deltaproteobacteria bacterium]
MTISTPSTFPRVAQQDLLTARLTSEPLSTILSRTNYLWQHHQPPLVDIAWLVGASMTRAQVFEFGLEPSADSLSYSFTHRWWVGGTAGSMSIKVEEYAGSWSTIYGPTSTATSANAWHSRTHSATISASATRLRVTYDHGVDAFFPSHLLAIPAPTTTPSAKQPSGFVAFDDGLLGSSGAPLNTEMLNRAKASCAAVLTDRKSMVLSMAQDTFSAAQKGQVTSVGIFSGSPSMTVGRAVASLPGNKGTTDISLHLRGYTSASSSTGYQCVVRQVGATHSGSSVTFDLDGSWHVSSTLTVLGEQPDIEVVLLNPDTTGTETAVVESLIGYWTPGS